VLTVDQFQRDQVPCDIAVECPGVAIHRSTQRPGKARGPFESCQPQARCPLGDIVGRDTRFSVDPGRLGLQVEFHQPRPVDDHHAAHAFVADQHIRTATQQEEGYIQLPQFLRGLCQLVRRADEGQRVCCAADARRSIAGERNILLQAVAKGGAQLG